MSAVESRHRRRNPPSAVWARSLLTGSVETRAIASLTVPGGQEFHFPHFSSNFDQIFVFFPQTLLIFFLILALRVGESPIREGPGYATGRDIVTHRPENVRFCSLDSVPCHSHLSLAVVLLLKVVSTRQRILLFPLLPSLCRHNFAIFTSVAFRWLSAATMWTRLKIVFIIT